MKPSTSSGPGFPRTLGAVWVLATLIVGVLGWLLFAVSELRADRLAGLVLLGVAVLGAVTAAAVLVNRFPARSLSLVASAVFVLGGVAAAVTVSASGEVFASDVLLLGGIPAAFGLATGLIALRGRSPR